MNRSVQAIANLLAGQPGPLPGVVRHVYAGLGRAHVATRSGLVDAGYSETPTVGQRVLVENGQVRAYPDEESERVYWV